MELSDILYRRRFLVSAWHFFSFDDFMPIILLDCSRGKMRAARWAHEMPQRRQFLSALHRFPRYAPCLFACHYFHDCLSLMVCRHIFDFEFELSFSFHWFGQLLIYRYFIRFSSFIFLFSTVYASYSRLSFLQRFLFAAFYLIYFLLLMTMLSEFHMHFMHVTFLFDIREAVQYFMMLIFDSGLISLSDNTVSSWYTELPACQHFTDCLILC